MFLTNILVFDQNLQFSKVSIIPINGPLMAIFNEFFIFVFDQKYNFRPKFGFSRQFSEIILVTSNTLIRIFNSLKR